MRSATAAAARGSGAAGTGGPAKGAFPEGMTGAPPPNNPTHPPFGMVGGEPGALGRNTVVRVDGSVEELPHIGKTDMQPGDLFVIETPGGGGYGPGKDRQ